MRADLRKGRSPGVLDDIPSGGAAVVICDPPWGTGDKQHQYGRRQSWDVPTDSQFIENDTDLEELRNTAPTIARILVEDGVAIVFCGQSRREAEDIMDGVGLTPFEGGVQWDKGRPGLSHKIRYAHEQILICALSEESLWAWRKPLLSPLRFPPVMHTAHPNEKPVPLFRHLISWALTDKRTDTLVTNQLVVDPFAGVCGTAMAAIALGQRWIGAECDDTWYPEADARLDALCGKFGRYPDSQRTLSL